MDAWQAQLERVKQQLAAMSASQKMLVGTLVAIMAATVLYWGRFAGTPEQVPVLDQPLSEADVGQIDHQLDLSGVAHTVVNGKVMIAADRRAEVLANLMFAHALPADTHSAFEEMTAKQLNPFSSQAEREATYSHARELDLTAIIRRWPGVADASVVINNRNDHRLDRSDPPTATVAISTRDAGDAAVARRLAESAAAGVAAAVSGLHADQVRVIIDGRTTRLPSRQGADPAGLMPDDVLEVQAREEAYFESKVRNQFAFIPGLNVTVTCDVQNQTRVEDLHEYDKKGAVSLPDYENNSTSEHRNADGTSPEPGAATNDGTANVGGANGPASLAGGGGSMAGGPVTTTSTTNDELTHNVVLVPTTQAHVITPAGKGTVRSAVVNIPISYIARVARQANPAVKDPSPAALQQVAAAEVARLRPMVANVVGLASATELISVGTYVEPDAVTADLTLAAAAGPAAAAPATGVLAAHAKEIAVAALAMVGLGLMFHTTRRSNAALPPLNASLGQSGGLGVGRLDAFGRGDGDDDGEDADEAPAADRVGPTSAIGGMAAVELDEETLRTQQMLDQVSTLVKEDPDAAAALVKRWVSRA